MSGTIDHSGVTLKFDTKLVKTANDAIIADDPYLVDWTLTLTNGTGANQASQQWHDRRTILASSNDDLDLAGVLTNAFGVTLTFTKIKAIGIKANAANANDVVVGNAAANGVSTIFGATTHTLKIKPGGIMILTAPDVNGYGITAATADILRIANGGAGSSVTYDIVIVGTD